MVSSVAAQQWKATELDAGVHLAADFAVMEQAKRAKTTVTLNKVLKASDKEPMLGARDFMLCLDTNVTNKQTFVQAIVTMDQYSNFRLMGWSKSTCGKAGVGSGSGTGVGSGSGFVPDKDYKVIDISHAGAVLAAEFAVKEQAEKTKSKITAATMYKAEALQPKLGATNFRLCQQMMVNDKWTWAQMVVTVDQYSNHKLVSWMNDGCGDAATDDFKPVKSGYTAGVDMAADWAVGKHSKDTGIAHKLVEILSREEAGMFAVTYRICMKVEEEGKTESVQAIVSRDQYSNHKLVSWKHSSCGK